MSQNNMVLMKDIKGKYYEKLLIPVNYLNFFNYGEKRNGSYFCGMKGDFFFFFYSFTISSKLPKTNQKSRFYFFPTWSYVFRLNIQAGLTIIYRSNSFCLTL